MLSHPRYVLRSITGYPNNPSASRSSAHQKEGTTWWIADTWNCYREVPLTRTQEYPSNGPKPLYAKGASGRLLVERNCVRLNDEQEAWDRENAVLT